MLWSTMLKRRYFDEHCMLKHASKVASKRFVLKNMYLFNFDKGSIKWTLYIRDSKTVHSQFKIWLHAMSDISPIVYLSKIAASSNFCNIERTWERIAFESQRFRVTSLHILIEKISFFIKLTIMVKESHFRFRGA